MRQRILSHLTYANVAATLALVIAIGGGSAYAANTVFSSDIVDNQVFSADVRDDTLTGGGLAAADLGGGSVGSSEVLNNSLTGADINEASLTGNVRRLNYSATATQEPEPAPITNVATVGPYTIKAECVRDLGGSTWLKVYANGPAGSANTMWSFTEGDVPDSGFVDSDGFVFPANTNARILFLAQGSQISYHRAGGTAMLKTGSTLVQVDVNAVADNRSGTESCSIYGTATKAT
jgi:hypothetical protein